MLNVPTFNVHIPCQICDHDGISMDAGKDFVVGWCENGHVWVRNKNDIREVYNFKVD